MTQIQAIPRATYQIQFNKDFTFADTERIRLISPDSASATSCLALSEGSSRQHARVRYCRS